MMPAGDRLKTHLVFRDVHLDDGAQEAVGPILRALSTAHPVASVAGAPNVLPVDSERSVLGRRTGRRLETLADGRLVLRSPRVWTGGDG